MGHSYTSHTKLSHVPYTHSVSPLDTVVILLGGLKHAYIESIANTQGPSVDAGRELPCVCEPTRIMSCNRYNPLIYRNVLRIICNMYIYIYHGLLNMCV